MTRPRGRAVDLEQRRLRAIALIEEEVPIPEVARRLRCAVSSVRRWNREFITYGAAVLDARATPGRPPRAQRELLYRSLTAPPVRVLATSEDIVALVEMRLGIRYSRSHMGRVMARLGWVYVRPEHGPYWAWRASSGLQEGMYRKRRRPSSSRV
jgi:transposase